MVHRLWHRLGCEDVSQIHPNAHYPSQGTNLGTLATSHSG